MSDAQKVAFIKRWKATLDKVLLLGDTSGLAARDYACLLCEAIAVMSVSADKPPPVQSLRDLVARMVTNSYGVMLEAKRSFEANRDGDGAVC